MNAILKSIEAAEPTRDNAPRIELRCGSDIRSVPIRLLWPGWLARGKLHILAGAPGTGKTTVALALAAAVTRGGSWPSGTSAPVGNVLIWSAEDDAADTMMPRLRAAGADASRIFIVGDYSDGMDKRAFDPAADIDLLEQEAERIGNVVLLIADPVVSAVTGDSHKNTEVRRALQPIVDLASRLDAAVLGITHFSKGGAGKDPAERVTGSIAFGALLVWSWSRPSARTPKQATTRDCWHGRSRTSARMAAASPTLWNRWSTTAYPLPWCASVQHATAAQRNCWATRKGKPTTMQANSTMPPTGCATYSLPARCRSRT
jgi:RecA-family ATPase